MKGNLFVRNGKALVSKVKFNGDVKESVTRAIDAIGGLRLLVGAGETVLIKPNFNTADPLPGSSDPQFVKAVIELLWEHGAGKVVLGESSMFALSTREVMEKTGMLKAAAQADAEVVVFDECDWVEVEVGGTYLEKVNLPKVAVEAQRIVFVPCLKAHRYADFTMSLKLAVGFLRPEEKRQLHKGNLQEKIAELNTVIHPDIMILDGRRCFISGGPDKGEVREPNVILASGDRIALDVESVRILQGYTGTSLKGDVWQLRQIRRAVELGLGVIRDEEFQVVED